MRVGGGEFKSPFRHRTSVRSTFAERRWGLRNVKRRPKKWTQHRCDDSPTEVLRTEQIRERNRALHPHCDIGFRFKNAAR